LRDPCVYMDWGDSFSEETRHRLLEGPDGLTAVATSHAGTLRRVRVDPTDGPAQFRIAEFAVEPVESLLPAPPRLSLPRRLLRRLLRRTPVGV
ncbi:hypothetical protein ABTO85_19435, partial [Acinetobacter baumannii]